MGKIEKTVEFDAAPEKVWAVVSDPSRFGEWLNMHKSWKGDVPTEFTQGAQVTAVVSLLNMPNTITWTVDRVRPAEVGASSPAPAWPASRWRSGSASSRTAAGSAMSHHRRVRGADARRRDRPGGREGRPHRARRVDGQARPNWCVTPVRGRRTFPTDVDRRHRGDGPSRDLRGHAGADRRVRRGDERPDRGAPQGRGRATGVRDRPVVHVDHAVGVPVAPPEFAMRVVHGRAGLPLPPADPARRRDRDAGQAARLRRGPRTARRTAFLLECRTPDGELVNEQYMTAFFRGVDAGQTVGELAPVAQVPGGGARRRRRWPRSSRTSTTTRRTGTPPRPATRCRSTLDDGRRQERPGCPGSSSTACAPRRSRRGRCSPSSPTATRRG